jgi:hypothetical protein
LRASEQLAGAVRYLEQERAGAGERLYESVRAIVDIARMQPSFFPRAPGIDDGEVRRGLVTRYGYWVIYEVFEERAELLVLSVWSGRQHPDGWR